MELQSGDSVEARQFILAGVRPKAGNILAGIHGMFPMALNFLLPDSCQPKKP
jgi:hypothetical protein